MGLDFSHGDCHFSYSGFMNFRSEIVKSISGYSQPSLREMYENGEFKQLSNDPIYPLINHSDCDGKLTINEITQILPRLKAN